MTQALTKKQEQPVTLKAILAKPEYQARFKEVLGDRAGQFMASLMSVGRTMPDVEPQSIIMAAMTAAALDLPVDKNLGFAWIVPYREGERKYAQFQMGYKGYVQLSLRSNVYHRMNACPVNAEAFGGYDDVGEPIILWDKVDESLPAVGYAFAYKLTNGFVKTAYWTKKKVQAHAERYSAAYRKGKDTPWKSHFDDMAMKTVIRHTLGRWGILSVAMQGAMQSDSGIQKDIDADVTYPDNDDGIQEAKRPEFDGPTPLKSANPPTAVADKPAQAPASAPEPSKPAAPVANAAPAPTQEQPAPSQTPTGRANRPTMVEPESPDEAEEAAAGLAPAQTPPAEPFVPNPSESDALQSVRLQIHALGISEPQLVAWMHGQKLLKIEQSKLSDAAESKLTKLAGAIQSSPAEFRDKIIAAK